MKKRFLPIPLVLLIPILLLITVIIAGVYRFSLTDEEIYQKQGRAMPATVAKVASLPEKSVMRQLFSLKDAQPWHIQLPESDVMVELSGFNGEHENRRAIGHYENGLEKGQIALNYFKLLPLNIGDPSQQMTFTVPYIVNNQGSGVFLYIGLFRLHHDSKHIEQLDSLFLGDRIQLDQIEVDIPFDVTSSIIAHYRTHTTEQAMSEQPNQTISLMIKVENDQLNAS